MAASNQKKNYRNRTIEVHGRVADRVLNGETVGGPVQSTAFEHDSAEDIRDVFKQRKFGYIYSRIANPTVRKLEDKITLLEDGLGTVVTSSGMAAVSMALLTILKQGDEFVTGNSLFAGCYALFTDVLPRFGITPKLVEATDVAAYEQAITPKTKLLFCEVIGNPKIDVPNIRALSELAHAHGIPLILDGTVATPALFRPKEFGVDIVVHSTSKYMNGHGNAIGGAVVDCGSFRFEGEKFSDFDSFNQKFQQFAFIAKARKHILINMGPCQSPHNAFLQLAGLETLSLRMRQHSDNALALAQFLEGHPKVKKVSYPGLKSSPFYDVAQAQFKNGCSGLLTFELAGAEEAFAFVNGRGLSRNLANIGDAKTLVIHPSSTIYHDYELAEQKHLGVNERLIRVSVGLEDKDDLIREFDEALAKA